MAARGGRGYPSYAVPTTGAVNRPGGAMPMVALIVLLLILAVFGAAGFALHFLWFVLIAALLLWPIGFFIGAARVAARRGWYGR